MLFILRAFDEFLFLCHFNTTGFWVLLYLLVVSNINFFITFFNVQFAHVVMIINYNNRVHTKSNAPRPFWLTFPNPKPCGLSHSLASAYRATHKSQPVSRRLYNTVVYCTNLAYKNMLKISSSIGIVDF